MDVYRKMNAAIAKVEKEERERDEFDWMSSGQRLKSVMAKSKRASPCGGSTQGTAQVARSSFDTVVKKEDERSDSQDNPSNFSSVLVDDKISQSAGKRNPVRVKAEPADKNMVETTVKNEMGNLPNSSMVRVKSGVGITYEFTEDELDNMALSERMKLYSKKRAPSFKIGRVVECSSEIAPSVSDCTTISAGPAKPLKVCPPRKQRKTATDSVQAAMEEDAPGLLRVLIEKGVSVDEMKLYGKNESNEPLDGLSFEDNFSELQAVISKVGKDLSEGEAKVLMSYGWIPNTGLGTMLKYCDRVIHDRITEKDGSEWKSKIEKLLVAGYSGGSIVENPVDHNVAQDFPEIKLELE